MATVTPLRLGPADHGRRLTAEEYLDAEVAEGYRYELARGVLEVSEIPDEAHFFIVSCLYDAVSQYRREHPGRVLVFGGGSEVRLWLPAMASGRHPDVAVVLQGTRKGLRGHRPPSLVVEVVSPGTEARERDHITKREEYLAFGLDEYWIVDPFDRRVLVLTRLGDVWAEASFAAGQEASGRALPGFRVPVDDLWAAHERGAADEPEG